MNVTIPDSRSASEMPVGTVVRMIADMTDRPTVGTEGTVTRNDGGWAVWVTWAGTDIQDFMSCRYLQFVSAGPEPVKVPSGPLALTIDGSEVTVTGSVKGDATHAACLPRPWVWSRSAGGYVLPRSLTPITRSSRVRQFRAACEAHSVPLTVEDSGTVESEAERRADRTERLEVRADRHERAAEHAATEADHRWQAFKQISDGIPMGQPILVGHHSERGHRADIRRMDGHMAKMSAAQKEADERARLADGIRTALERGESPVTIRRRIDKCGTDLRRIERRFVEDSAARKFLARGYEATGSGAVNGLYPLTDEHRAILEAERTRLSEAVELDTGTLAAMEAAGRTVTYSRANVVKGGLIRTRGSWRRVVRVNAKSVSVETGYSWTDTVPYSDVTGYREPQSATELPADD